MVDAFIEGLRARLHRWPEDRFPVKSAELRHRLGAALVGKGDHAGAISELRQAEALYEELPLEQAMVRNDLGAVLRESGDRLGAQQCFELALLTFRAHGEELAAASAAHNLGLVLAETGSASAATAAFREALTAFDPNVYPTEAGATMRGLGAALVVGGDFEQAIEVLSRAIEFAAAGGDRPGLAASANTLGLAHLAEGRAIQAAAAFAESASASPESIRPEAFAMAKANLALAYEAGGELDRARLAARQAITVPMVPEVVLGQARALLLRIGDHADLHAILDSEPASDWAAILRDEVQRWNRLSFDELSIETSDWLEGLEGRPAVAVERLVALFEVVLELPSDAMSALLHSLAASAGLGENRGERFVSWAGRAAARFRLPQMQRLERELGIGEARP